MNNSYYNKNDKYVKYNDFCSSVENNEIEKVKINDKKVIFVDKDGKEYFTTNPESTTFKEYLLTNDIEVNEEISTLDILSYSVEILMILVLVICIYVTYTRTVGKEKFKVCKKSDKNFDDVVGMNRLKEDMKEILDIMNNRNEYAKKGIKMPKGIILEGNPGNGKTLFAKALAGEANMKFIPTKATDFESAVMAIGPAKIKSLFKIARRNAPCIIFIDEFDGIGTKRNYSGSAIETENTRIVTALLNELDGFKENSGVLVVVAVNNSKVLDEALIRPGRFDRKYMITYPNANEREELFKFYLSKVDCNKNINIKNIVEKTNGMPCSQIDAIVNEASMARNRLGLEKINDECLMIGYKMVSESITLQ